MQLQTSIQWILIVLAVQVSNSISSVNDPVTGSSSKSTNSFASAFHTHRVIRKFSHRFSLPRPRLPTLPRPSFPFPVFSRSDKGDTDNLHPSGRERRRKKGKSPSADTPGDRTLLTKAIIAKKAIILAKLAKKKKAKKWRKKLAVAGLAAYGLNKIVNKGAFTIKTPKVKLTVGAPSSKEEDEEAEDIDDIMDEDEDDLDSDLDSSSESESNTSSPSPNKIQQQSQSQVQNNTPTPQHLMPQSDQSSSSKKKGKKKKKKAKKKKSKYPRPVDLGVKANLYKKFDDLTKQAQNKLSSYIQVDIDFIGRSALDDMIQPGRFLSRTAQVSDDESYEVVPDIQVPGNFIPSWSTPVWNRQYPERKTKSGASLLKPVYVLFSKSPGLIPKID